MKELKVNKQKKGLSEYDDKPLKDNAILIHGDPSVDVLQWIALDLLEKGFQVRISCKDRSTAIKAFGLPGVPKEAMSSSLGLP